MRKRTSVPGKGNHRKRQRVNKKRQENHPLTPKPAICSVCSIDDTKYKCPTCNALYCSVACCKKHKESCSKEKKHVAKSDLNEHDNTQPFVQRQNLYDSDDQDGEWKITDEMKNSLKHSQWLHNELKDGGIRLLINQIVSSGNRKDVVLQQVKERYSLFSMFLDKVLLLGGVLERQEASDEDEAFHDLLSRDWNEEDYPKLALRQASRPMPMFEPIQHSSSSSSASSDESETSSSSEVEAKDDSSSSQDEASESDDD